MTASKKKFRADKLIPIMLPDEKIAGHSTSGPNSEPQPANSAAKREAESATQPTTPKKS
jgi:hypothetical protein